MLAAGTPVTVLVLASFALLSVAACDSKPRGEAKAGRQYGEPIGIELQASGPIPALSMAVAVTKGRDPSVMVGPLATALYGAARACPEFVKAMSAGKTARLELGAEKDALLALGAPADEVGGQCMTTALGGKTVKMDKPDAMDLVIELRLGAKDASTHP